MLKTYAIGLGILIAWGCLVHEAEAQRPGGPNKNRNQAGADRQQRAQRGNGQEQRMQQLGQGQGQAGQGQQGGDGQGQGLNAQEAAQRMMTNFDANGDGALDIDELTNGLTALEQAMRQRQGGQQRRGQGQRGVGQQAGIGTTNADGQFGQLAQRGGRRGAEQNGLGRQSRGGRQGGPGGAQRRGQ